ncbi:MAG: DNA-directed RNA polymerase subunit omega [Oligoflexales bacterium]|nr:DNA-directed RNA polymerase subunit omega [Oligoflexales bacterium]
MARISIEDCLRKLPNRFALVIAAANRTRQLMSNSHPLVKSKNKETITALREIAEGKVTVKGYEPKKKNPSPTP